MPGAGGAAGLDVTVDLAVLALRAGARIVADGPGHRSAVFGTLYDVDRRRFLTSVGALDSGVTGLPAPGGMGGGGAVELIVLQTVRAGARLHLDPVRAATETELFTEVGTSGVHVAARVLQRADARTGELVPLRAPLFVVAEGAWSVWPPLSLVARWLRAPRFHPAGGSTAPAALSIDDDVVVGLSADVVLAPR